ncbi:MAG: hypothetical protein JKY95_16885 [Planctomycetaceae bacterium]|nr:hypothetical protein [Planctomycetaceae bacterium]
MLQLQIKLKPVDSSSSKIVAIRVAASQHHVLHQSSAVSQFHVLHQLSAVGLLIAAEKVVEQNEEAIAHAAVSQLHVVHQSNAVSQFHVLHQSSAAHLAAVLQVITAITAITTQM